MAEAPIPIMESINKQAVSTGFPDFIISFFLSALIRSINSTFVTDQTLKSSTIRKIIAKHKAVIKSAFAENTT